MKWTGILIEADRKSFNVLMSRKRKSYALSVCLSLEPYPTQVLSKHTHNLAIYKIITELFKTPMSI